MNIKYEIISKKYATAFLNLHEDKLEAGQEKQNEQLQDFLEKHRSLHSFLLIPALETEKKRKVLHMLVDKFKLDPHYKQLMDLLLEHGRIHLLKNVVRQIYDEWMKRKNKEKFYITSSHEMTKDEMETIIRFIKSHVSTDIITHFSINPELICGLRIQSKRYLWERSIAKKLKTAYSLIL
jgi:ATP synthase F1 delta subunit